MDEKYEVTEEETLVVVEFAGNSGEEALKQDNPFFKIIGVDTDEPVMQIGNHLFSGEYGGTPGTEMIFEAKDNRETVDRIFDEKTPHTLEFVAKTNKKLLVKRVFVSPKQAAEKNDQSSTSKS